LQCSKCFRQIAVLLRFLAYQVEERGLGNYGEAISFAKSKENIVRENNIHNISGSFWYKEIGKGRDRRGG